MGLALVINDANFEALQFGSVTPKTVAKLNKITISIDNTTIVGSSGKINVAYEPLNTPSGQKGVTFVSNNNNVSVDSSGNITIGSALTTATTVQVYAKSDYKDSNGNSILSNTLYLSCKYSDDTITEISSVNAPSDSIVGTEAQFTVTLLPEGTTQGVTWSLNDTTYASIDANGKLTIKPNCTDSHSVTVTATPKVGSAAAKTKTVTIMYSVALVGFTIEYDENGSVADKNGSVIEGEGFYLKIVPNPSNSTQSDYRLDTAQCSGTAISKEIVEGNRIRCGIDPTTSANSLVRVAVVEYGSQKTNFFECQVKYKNMSAQSLTPYATYSLAEDVTGASKSIVDGVWYSKAENQTNYYGGESVKNMISGDVTSVIAMVALKDATAKFDNTTILGNMPYAGNSGYMLWYVDRLNEDDKVRITVGINNGNYLAKDGTYNGNKVYPTSVVLGALGSVNYVIVKIDSTSLYYYSGEGWVKVADLTDYNYTQTQYDALYVGSGTLKGRFEAKIYKVKSTDSDTSINKTITDFIDARNSWT